MDATIPCVCPPRADGTPRHDHDTITFRERLDFRSGLAIRQQIALEKGTDPGMAPGEVLALLTESYLVYGIESWTLVDARGKLVEPSRPAIRAFLQEHPDEAMAAGDVADEQYAEQVLLPLLQRASPSSPQSPTPEPTSATPASSGSRSTSRKRSRRSSTSTTPTDATGSITSLPGGGSRSSRNSASAA
jgi:hypothetical protein